MTTDLSGTDFRYYLKWDFETIFKYYDGNAGYLYLKAWNGGLNNIRMTLELGVCLAFLTNRCLILPPKHAIYPLKGQAGFSSFFETQSLGVKQMSIEAFCDLKNITTGEQGIREISKVLNYDSVGNVTNFEKVPIPGHFTKGRGTVHAFDLFDDTYEVLFSDGNLLGNFYQSIYSSRLIALKQLVAKYVIFKKQIFDIAEQFINYLGDRCYYAIHIRRDDFQHKELFISCEEIVQYLEHLVPSGSKLYIATDHHDRSFFYPLMSKYQTAFFDNIESALDLDTFDGNWVPAMEQLICTRALKFVGMKYSTFSSYIYRLRGYMDDIHDDNYYLNGSIYSSGLQTSFRDDSQYIANWVRDYKDVWDLDHPSMFIAMIAYDENDLIQTMENLLDNASHSERLYFGILIKGSKTSFRKFLTKKYSNTRVLFSNKRKKGSRALLWNRIKNELYEDEQYFLQIEPPNAFSPKWDETLINQLESIEVPNPIISTLPNHFDSFDENTLTQTFGNNSPLQLQKTSINSQEDSQLTVLIQPPLKDFELVSTQWVSNLLIFTHGRWVKKVRIPDETTDLEEEELLTVTSIQKGYDLRITSETLVWHRYDFD
ncbi:MAG: GlcNAc-transferase family protein [Bacteroidota bacterium]